MAQRKQAAHRRAACRNPFQPDQPLRRSLIALAATDPSFLLAANLMISPVDGLRPWGSALTLTLNLPKPLMATWLPFTAAEIV